MILTANASCWYEQIQVEHPEFRLIWWERVLKRCFDSRCSSGWNLPKTQLCRFLTNLPSRQTSDSQPQIYIACRSNGRHNSSTHHFARWLKARILTARSSTGSWIYQPDNPLTCLPTTPQDDMRLQRWNWKWQSKLYRVPNVVAKRWKQFLMRTGPTAFVVNRVLHELIMIRIICLM